MNRPGRRDAAERKERSERKDDGLGGSEHGTTKECVTVAKVYYILCYNSWTYFSRGD